MAKTWNDSVKLVIKDCYFGDNPAAVYNFIEMTTKLADGSEISGNTWTAGSYGHNIINIYGADDNSEININDNIFVKSANAIRVGTRGSVQDCVINMKNNSYDTTDSDENYAGLFMIQPYAKATTDMSGVTINCDNTINNSGVEQIGYYASGSNDAQLVDAQRPKVYIDKVKMTYQDSLEGGYTIGKLIPEV